MSPGNEVYAVMRSIDRWQHRLKREHPTCTERTKALIEECGWTGGDSGDSAGVTNKFQIESP